MTAHTHPAYPLIVAAARAAQWPRRFRRDLTFHDRRELAKRDPSEPFVWALRENGTHLVYPRGWARARDGAHRFEDLKAILTTIARDFSDGAAAQWFFWDGRELWNTTFARALELSADEFERARPHLQDLI